MNSNSSDSNNASYNINDIDIDDILRTSPRDSESIRSHGNCLLLTPSRFIQNKKNLHILNEAIWLKAINCEFRLFSEVVLPLCSIYSKGKPIVILTPDECPSSLPDNSFGLIAIDASKLTHASLKKLIRLEQSEPLSSFLLTESFSGIIWLHRAHLAAEEIKPLLSFMIDRAFMERDLAEKIGFVMTSVCGPMSDPIRTPAIKRHAISRLSVVVIDV